MCQTCDMRDLKDMQGMDLDLLSEFEEELRKLVNKYSFENGSNTPDYVLAKYMSGSMLIFHLFICRMTLMIDEISKIDKTQLDKDQINLDVKEAHERVFESARIIMDFFKERQEKLLNKAILERLNWYAPTE